jgi:hypothetical protein
MEPRQRNYTEPGLSNVDIPHCNLEDLGHNDIPRFAGVVALKSNSEKYYLTSKFSWSEIIPFKGD